MDSISTSVALEIATSISIPHRNPFEIEEPHDQVCGHAYLAPKGMMLTGSGNIKLLTTSPHTYIDTPEFTAVIIICMLMTDLTDIACFQKSVR